MCWTTSSASVGDLTLFLEGDWILKKRVRSREPWQTGFAQGRATFSRAPDGLLYHETVQLHYGDYQGRASRSYRYCPRAPGIADVFFTDRRFFHTLNLRSGRWHAEHLCGPDVYRGDFRVIDEARWLVRWRATGPRKNVSILTVYERPSPLG